MKFTSFAFVASFASCFSLVQGQTTVTETMTLEFTTNGEDLLFNFTELPTACSDVTITGSFQGDIDGSDPDEDAVLILMDGTTDGLTLITLGNGTGVPYPGNLAGQCQSDTGSTTIDAATLNALSTMQVLFSFNAGEGVTAEVCPDDEATVTISYLTECPATTEGDPHFRTWHDEHFEFHGQCDIVMTKVQDFVEPGVDLDIQIRTSLVRYWSYIKNAAIRIGNDVLEVQGSAEDHDNEFHYWLNYEYQAEMKEFAGFPVEFFVAKGSSYQKNRIEIDLSPKYPGQKIVIKTFKEFVGVKMIGATEESFGNAVGITGNFKTGKTLARDGATELNDFTELGLEWQVLPSDGKLFREMAKPQFPEKCYLPEDPRGERARRLDESDITEEAAEKACSGLKDEFERKGCIYDIIATQDLDMVGAY